MIMIFCGAYLMLFYSIILFIRGIVTLKTTEFAVTNRRIIAKTGFIKRNSVEILLLKVESISVRQNILGRLINIGPLTITGTGGTKEIFRAIAEPLSIRHKTNQVIEHYTDQLYKQSSL